MNAMTVRGHLPRVLAATFAVVLVPLVAVKALEAAIGLHSPLLSIAAVVALSFAVATGGAALWARHPASRDLVFGDLMLWGWIRRVRAERRLAKVHRLLGAGRSGASVLDTDLGPEEQTELLERLASALEARDPHTHGHTQRVTRHTEMIALGMGLPEEQVARFRTAAVLHDVGKMQTPREVLNKPGKLTDEEFATIKRHPVDGARLVAGLGDADMTAMVRHHHERIDGRGYPDGLSGEEIPLGARVIAVADTFDAITSARPYRKAMPHRKALEILKSEAGKQLDADAVDSFLAYYSGSRSASRWSFLVTAPERLAGSLREALHTTAAAPIAKNAVAVAATAVLGTSLAAPIANAVDSKAAPATTAESAPASGGVVAGYVGAGSGPAGSRAADRAARDAKVSAGAARSGPRKTGRAGRPAESTAAPGDSAAQPDSSAGGSQPQKEKAGKTDKRRSESAPGRNGTAPGLTKKPDKPKPDKPVTPQPAAPANGGPPPGQVNKPASPGGGPPAGSPAHGGGNGSGNAGKK